MEGWQIALLIVGIVLGIFLLFVIFDVVFVLSFNKLFKKHQKAMVIFLNMKYDNIKKLIDLMTSYGVEIDRKIIATVADIHREDFDNVENEACKKAQETLTYIKEELLVTNPSGTMPTGLATSNRDYQKRCLLSNFKALILSSLLTI